MAAAFDVRLEIQEHTGDAAAVQAFFDRGDDPREIAEDALVARIAKIGWDEMGEMVFVDVLRFFLYQ